MTFVSITETFVTVLVALITALGGLELFKWIKRTWFPKKTEQRLDESEAAKSEVEVQQAVQDIQKSINDVWQQNVQNFMEVDSARIKELREANEVVNKANVGLNNQISDLLKAGARKDEIISDKVTRIRELEESNLNITKEYEGKITTLTQQLGHLEKMVMFYRSWHCEREYGRGKENCMRRKPAQNPPLKYCPPEIEVVQVVETDPLLIPECVDCKPKPKTKTKK